MDDRELLLQLEAGCHSGDALARAFGVTRAAVWKRIRGLRAAGVEIGGKAGEGYALAAPLDLLDAPAIEQALAPAAAAALAGLEVVWMIDSTNSALLQRPVPARGARVLMAEGQRGGRGRRGRGWASPLAAHLYLSVSRGFGGGLAGLAGLSLAAGVAVAEALRAHGAAGVGLKWPNDLVVDGHKLGGLLVEGGGEFAGTARAVVGLGLNVRMPAGVAATIDQPWAQLSALVPAPVRRNAAAAAVLSRLLPALEQFDAEGLAPFLPRYAALDALAGRAVRVLDGSQVREGVAEGLADDGGLRLRARDGSVQVFHAGEVSVRAA